MGDNEIVIEFAHQDELDIKTGEIVHEHVEELQ
jgi:hypothetical protein